MAPDRARAWGLLLGQRRARGTAERCAQEIKAWLAATVADDSCRDAEGLSAELAEELDGLDNEQLEQRLLELAQKEPPR